MIFEMHLVKLKNNNMITKNQMMQLLIEASPSFAKKWKEMDDDFFEDLVYLQLAEFGRHVVELQLSNSTEEFPPIFTVIERFQEEGDEYVKETAVMGILEAIQNQALDKNVELKTFEPYLLPISKENWSKLIQFWKGKK
jgi:hypothetical protein